MHNPLATEEHDELAEDRPQPITGKPMTRSDRRRKFRHRRRNHGSKLGPRDVTPVERNPREHLTLVGSSLLGVVQPKQLADEQEVDAACTDRLEELDDPMLDEPADAFGDPEPDTFDGAILMASDDEALAEFADSLPFGFHLENGGGAHSRHLGLVRMAQVAQAEPDWGDPENWDMGRHEPHHLIVRTV